MPQSGKAGPFIGIIVVSIKKIRAKTPAVGSARSMSHGSLESIFILFLGQIFVGYCTRNNICHFKLGQCFQNQCLIYYICICVCSNLVG